MGTLNIQQSAQEINTNEYNLGMSLGSLEQQKVGPLKIQPTFFEGFFGGSGDKYDDKHKDIVDEIYQYSGSEPNCKEQNRIEVYLNEGKNSGKQYNANKATITENFGRCL